jgi:hypothetical protein
MGETVKPNLSIDRYRVVFRADIGLFRYFPICEQFIDRGIINRPCLLRLSLFEEESPVMPGLVIEEKASDSCKS